MYFEIRFLIAIAMLACASYYDIKTRQIHDIIPLSFGMSGIVVYFFEWNEFEIFNFISLGISFTAVLLFFLLIVSSPRQLWEAIQSKILKKSSKSSLTSNSQIGGADFLHYIALMVILPYTFSNFFEDVTPLTFLLLFLSIPLMIIFCGSSSSSLTLILINIVRNMQYVRKGNKLFADLDEPSEILSRAFYKIHVNDVQYKFVTPMEFIQDGKKKLKDFIEVGDDNLPKTAKKGQYVAPLVPQMPYLLGFCLVVFVISMWI